MLGPISIRSSSKEEDRSLSRHLVVLSGNVGVGKSTFGPHLARELDAIWLSESDISRSFAYLFKDESRTSRIISQIAFASVRMATIFSAFMSGASTVVAERSLPDSRIFHQVWRKRFQIEAEDQFFDQLYSLLDQTPIDFRTSVIWLRCPVDTIMKRLNIRREAFENVHTREVLNDLDRGHRDHFANYPPDLVLEMEKVEAADSSMILLAQSAAQSLAKRG
jgi:deoxyadenosine/deoxycytidine kinase